MTIVSKFTERTSEATIMYKFLVIGLSAGGHPMIQKILKSLPKEYPLPIAVVSHLSAGKDSELATILNKNSNLDVSMAIDKEFIQTGHVYIAPPDYHLLIEQDSNFSLRFALSIDSPVKSVRPSIDVLFQTAAEVFESSLIAVLLSGANSDGVEGLTYVQQLGGLSIILNPEESEFSTMSKEGIEKSNIDYIVSLDEIISLLLSVYEIK